MLSNQSTPIPVFIKNRKSDRGFKYVGRCRARELVNNQGSLEAAHGTQVVTISRMFCDSLELVTNRRETAISQNGIQSSKSCLTGFSYSAWGNDE
jgi:hypothetical protein